MMANTAFRIIVLCSLAVVCALASCDTNKNCTSTCDNGYHEHCQTDKTCACLQHECVTYLDCPVGNKNGCPLPEKEKGVAMCIGGWCQCIRPNANH